VRFRRFINRSVAEILASREREAMLFMLTKLGSRKKSASAGRKRAGIWATLLGLIVVSSLSPAIAKADDPDARDPGDKLVVRDHRLGPPIVCGLNKLCIERICI
jgi:hypothetical protein